MQMNTPSVNGTDGAELFCVFKAASNSPALDRPAFKCLDAPNGTFHGYGWYLPHSNGQLVGRYAGDAFYGVAPGVDLTSAFHVINIAAKTNYFHIRLDGVLLYSNTSHAFGSTADSQRLGLDERQATQWQGKMAALIQYTKMLNATERVQNETFFMTGAGAPL
jgi:hypothetical protein